MLAGRGERTRLVADGADQFRDIYGLENQLRVAGVGTGERQHIFEQTPGLAAFLDDFLKGAAARRIGL
jgi:hypothetical protein